MWHEGQSSRICHGLDRETVQSFSGFGIRIQYIEQTKISEDTLFYDGKRLFGSGGVNNSKGVTNGVFAAAL